MKRLLSSLLLPACAALGCMTLPSWWEKPKSEPIVEVAPKPARPRPIVTADEITDNNGQEMASALREELERDGQAAPPALPENSSSEKPQEKRR